MVDYNDNYNIEERNKGYYNYKNIYFPSNNEKQLIVDAISGSEYPWRIGTYNEKRFFKVTDSVGNINTHKNCSSNHLYYQSPEAYMKHKNVTLEDSIVKEWYDKYNFLFPNNIFDEKAYKIFYNY